MERYRTVLSRQAAADIRGAVRYIAADLQEPATAAHMLKRFEAAVSSLETMPERYALVSDGYLASLGLRSAPVGNYLLFYVVNRPARRVEVVRVLHGRRNWTQLLMETGPL